jgi:hypothetical protein
MAAPSDPSPTRAPRTLAVVLPISLALLVTLAKGLSRSPGPLRISGCTIEDSRE